MSRDTTAAVDNGRAYAIMRGFMLWYIDRAKWWRDRTGGLELEQAGVMQPRIHLVTGAVPGALSMLKPDKLLTPIQYFQYQIA